MLNPGLRRERPRTGGKGPELDRNQGTRSRPGQAGEVATSSE